MVFVNEWPTQSVSDARTVDHERGAVLKSEGGGGSSKEKDFSLVWKGFFVRFTGLFNTKKNSDDTESIEWGIIGLRIPLSLKSQTEEIKLMISEAMEAHGFLYDKQNFIHIAVTLPEKAMYYDDQPQQVKL